MSIPDSFRKTPPVLAARLAGEKISEAGTADAFVDSLLQQLNALPGVQAVGVTQAMPLMGDYSLIL